MRTAPSKVSRDSEVLEGETAEIENSSTICTHCTPAGVLSSRRTVTGSLHVAVRCNSALTPQPDIAGPSSPDANRCLPRRRGQWVMSHTSQRAPGLRVHVAGNWKGRLQQLPNLIEHLYSSDCQDVHTILSVDECMRRVLSILAKKKVLFSKQ